MGATNDSLVVTVEPGGSSTRQGPPAAVFSGEDVELISRLVLGLVLFGGEELLFRLRAAQQRIHARGDLATVGIIPDDETMTEVMGYLTLGMLMRGQRRLAQAVNRGFHFWMNAAGWALGTLSGVTDNRLARPLRQPIERGIWGLVMEGQGAIQDGRREVVASRALADETMEELVKEVIQTLAENPELTSAIERVFVGQGAGLAGTAVGSARQLSTSADDLAEGVVRRLLGRKPRRELPPSPLAGKPLTMYVGGNSAQGAQADE